MLDFNKPMQFTCRSQFYGRAQIIRRVCILAEGTKAKAHVLLIELAPGEALSMQRVATYEIERIEEYVENIPPTKKKVWVALYRNCYGNLDSVVCEERPDDNDGDFGFGDVDEVLAITEVEYESDS
jgi:hypothetical protein